MPSQSTIKSILNEFDIDQFGFAKLDQPPKTIDKYEMWLAKGFAAEMNYLSAHLEKKKNPELVLEGATSAIVFTKYYVPFPINKEPAFSALKIAKYARGADYHNWFQNILLEISQKLTKAFPDQKFLPMTDSKPVLERDLAVQAGLGWIGKNTCLIDRKKGSYSFIGEIYTTLEIKPSETNPKSFCGKCTACIDACPTQALESPMSLNSNLCISYLTIEAKGISNSVLRSQTGSHFFGCDICQDVCPWNKKQNLQLETTELKHSREEIISELKLILESSNNKLLELVKATPLSRAGAVGIKRNALVVIANEKYTELRSLVEKYIDHKKLGELAAWTLKYL